VKREQLCCCTYVYAYMLYRQLRLCMLPMLCTNYVLLCSELVVVLSCWCFVTAVLGSVLLLCVCCGC
jgi:hypothetical protein